MMSIVDRINDRTKFGRVYGLLINSRKSSTYPAFEIIDRYSYAYDFYNSHPRSKIY